MLEKSPSADWAGIDSPIGRYILEESNKTLGAYRSQPSLVDEQANQEQDTARGGYAHRQIVELIQNSADQLARATDGTGHIRLRLTDTCLYCADAGAAINEEGARALLFSHLSPKRNTLEIGRFGVGFKSVLGISDSPGLFSRSGSFRFSRDEAKRRIREVAPTAEHCPVLRIAEPVDPHEEAKSDHVLHDLMTWATNIVRLPLKPGAHEDLIKQMQEFRAEFLLFVPHVRRLEMRSDDGGIDRMLQLVPHDRQYEVTDGERRSRWMVFSRLHRLTDSARDDRRALDDADEVELKWAAPLDVRRTDLQDLQHFWAFFPTMTSSLVAGILNAPWKTNEDRQNLLPGPYNDELIAAAAELVANAIPYLSTAADPARHLDVLPRRKERGDNDHANRLRDEIYKLLKDREIVPDQNGELQQKGEMYYPPKDLIRDRKSIASGALEIWGGYEHRPSAWLHHSAFTVNRLGVVDRIFDSGRGYGSLGAPRASVAEWLKALVIAGEAKNDAIRASRTAIAAAAALPENIRKDRDLGEIVLTYDNSWKSPHRDAVFLSGGLHGDPSTTVHPQLENDADTRKALDTLGVKPPSPESRLRNLAAELSRSDDDSAQSDSRWSAFWECTRDVDQDTVIGIVKESFSAYVPRAKTLAGTWIPLNEVLLPGEIVPDDGSRDNEVAVDFRFHEKNLPLLKALGVVDRPRPRGGYELSEKYLRPYRNKCVTRFANESRESTGSSPQWHHLVFDYPRISGPLEVFEHLSDEGRARFTEALLNLDSTFEQWTMRHRTQEKYPPLKFPSPAIHALRKHGRVSVGGSIHPLVDGLGDEPESPAVQRRLLEHPKTHRIRQAFPELVCDFGSDVEPVGDDEPVPLLDVWPGLSVHMDARNLLLIRCDRIVNKDGKAIPSDCVKRENSIYLVRQEGDRAELKVIVRELNLDMDDDEFEAVLRRETPQDTERARRQIAAQPDYAARLLEAVGEKALRRRLPETLIDILERQPEPFVGERVADAAIATFHTGALREYRHDIRHLDPPHKWAGSPRALAFVQSLGFAPEWAGKPTPKRTEFVDVPGPRSLPDLHDYQQAVVCNVKSMLGNEGENETRGLVSMPTGSGKTRVAVQAVIEAICDSGLSGGILWVADRDELCEQAVEAWRQAWASIGPETKSLRISRWWGGQRQPELVDGNQVIVATIQTLRARIGQGSSQQALAGITLLVVDEAHGSIAPSYTQLMKELGLTFRRREGEPFLLGLTATPYRGYNEEETARLVARYGRNRLDSGAFKSDDPERVIAQLQRMAVLAEADHDTIAGARLSLSAEELREIEEEKLPWLPKSVEQLIAEDADRTRSIVAAYRSRVVDAIDAAAPTLIFATSVEHAKTVAAMLQLDGVKARAVSGETDAAVRRDVVERFREGDVKVLVNYGVFREGFDAPRTRAIIVARPVYSPNLYFQMIGRGLRGTLNGGSDRCLILDVEDNIENYDRALAFSELDWLWAPRRPSRLST